MILSDYDIACRREEAEKKGHDKPNLIGHPVQYFFAHPVGNGETGICGVEGKLLGIRDGNENDPDNLFYADLAILSHVPDFYVEYLNVPVTSVSIKDKVGVEDIGLCEYASLEIVMQTVNAAYRPNGKPDLKLIVSNSEKN